jgi:hypothetical protein
MSGPLSRREALTGFALMIGAAGVLRIPEAHAAELPHLSLTDLTAVALGYHNDAKTVDAKAFPTYRPGEMCSNCLQLEGTPGPLWRPCKLYPGKLVNVNGWCMGWVKRT